MKLQFASIIAIIAAICALFCFTSCNKKTKIDPNKVTDTIAVNYLTSIEADQAMTVNFKQADGKPMITVTCNKTIANNLNVRVENGVLKTNFKTRSHVPDNGVIINITAPALESIHATNAAEIFLGDKFNADGNFSIVTTNAGSVRAKEFTCGNLTLSASDASQIRFDKLTCANLKATATSASLILLKGNAANYEFIEGTVSEIRANGLNGTGKRIPIDEENLKKIPKKETVPAAQPDTTKKAEAPAPASPTTTTTPAAAVH